MVVATKCAKYLGLHGARNTNSHNWARFEHRASTKDQGEAEIVHLASNTCFRPLVREAITVGHQEKHTFNIS